MSTLSILILTLNFLRLNAQCLYASDSTSYPPFAIDVCNENFGNSFKFICDSGIALEIIYNENGCSGSVNQTIRLSESYYGDYNCYGSSSDCSFIDYTHDCDSDGAIEYTFVANTCSDNDHGVQLNCGYDSSNWYWTYNWDSTSTGPRRSYCGYDSSNWGWTTNWDWTSTGSTSTTYSPSTTHSPYCDLEISNCYSPSAISSDSSTSAGFVVAITVFIVLSVLCIAVFILCFIKGNKKESEPESAAKGGQFVAANVILRTSESDRFSITSDDNMSNTDLISNGYDPTDCDDVGQKNLPCCWYCRPDFSLFCRFRLFYFFYFLSFETGILYITNELADAQLKGGEDDFEVYNGGFLAIAALICFAFSVFLGKLSDIHGRRRYIRITVIVTTIPFLALLIYPNIWLYFGLVPLIGFVGATSTLTGLFVTYITDVMPKAYLAAGFAAIQSTEGTAGLFAAMIIGIIGVAMPADDYQGALGVVTGIFMFTFLISLCMIGESLPLQKRNLKPDDPTKSKYNFFQIWLDTLKENRLLYIMCVFYFFVLFSFSGLEYLIHQKSSFIKLFEGAFDSDTDTDSEGDGNQYFIWFLCISLGMKVGKSWSPLILCLTGCCIKTILNKIIFFIVTLVVALLLFAGLKWMEFVLFDDLGPIYAMAAVSGIIFAWGKLLLPLINVLVRGSSNKLERGRTFGVLSSIESICDYIAPLTVINLWNGNSNTRILSVVVCFIAVIIGSIWLQIKIRPILIPQTRFDAKSVSSINGGGDSTQYGDTDVISTSGTTAGAAPADTAQYVAPSAPVQSYESNDGNALNANNANNLQKDMFDL